MKYLLFVTLLISTQSIALKSEVGAEVGFRTNALLLETNLKSDAYLKYWFNTEHTHKFNKKNKIQAKFKVENTNYFDLPSDKFRLDYRLRYSKTFNIGKYSNNLMFTHDFRMERQVYYNRIADMIAQTKDGISLSERYNFLEPKLSVEWIFRFNSKNSLSLYGFVAKRDYMNDYEDIDVDALDYFESGMQVSYRYKGHHDFNLRLFAYDKTRYYEQFRNGDLDGAAIDGSILKYHFTGYGVLMNKLVNKKYLFTLYGSGYLADDNEVGYRDMVYHSLDFSVQKNISDSHFWKIGTKVYIKDFLLDSTRPIEVLKGNPGRIKFGSNLNLYHQDDFLNKFIFYQKASFNHELNSLSLLTYTDVLLAIGLKYEF